MTLAEGYCLATGVEAGRTAVDALCRAGMPPLLAVGYSQQLSGRAGYVSLRELADRYGFALIETGDINGPEVIELVDSMRPRALVVAGWSQIVRPPTLARFEFAVGVHPTLLPDGRGRAPIPWTLIKGLPETGVTLFHLEAEVDAGDIVGVERIPLSLRDDATSLYDRVADAHASLLCHFLPMLLAGTAPRQRQRAGGSVWPRRRPEDGVIDWALPARDVFNWVRGLTHPYPGSFTFAQGRRMSVWMADLLESVVSGDPPGTVVGPVWSTADGGVAVSVRDGLIVLRRVSVDGPEEDALAVWERGDLRTGELLGRS